MNNYYWGLAAGILGLILDTILPIVLQECDIEVYSYMCIMSVFFLAITTIYLNWFKKTGFNEMLQILQKKSTDIRIMFYGFLRYLKYVLFTYGLLIVNPGLYNTLINTEIILYSIYSHFTSKTNPNMIELSGYGLSAIVISLIAYYYISNKKGINNKWSLFYGVLLIISALSMDFIDSEYFSELESNPFEDIFLSSIVMVIISVLVMGGRMLLFNSSFEFGGLQNILYILGITIFLCNYVPSLLEFSIFDWLNPPTIMALFIGQFMFGFILEKYYEKSSFPLILLIMIGLLLIGSSLIIIGYMFTNDKTDFSIFNHIRNIKFFGMTQTANSTKLTER